MSETKFKVGDKVIVKPAYVDGEFSDGEYTELKGKIGIIVDHATYWHVNFPATTYGAYNNVWMVYEYELELADNTIDELNAVVNQWLNGNSAEWAIKQVALILKRS